MLKQSVNIFLNDNISFLAAQGGIVRYFRRIIDGVVVSFGKNAVVFSSEQRDYGLAKVMHPRQLGPRQRRLIHDFQASIAAWHKQATIFVSPYYGNAWTTAAEVFTVHDMIAELMPEFFSRKQINIRRFIAEKKRCLERAVKLIAVSESTARDIVAYYPHIDPAKIVVIHHGVDACFFERITPVKNVSQKPYFLFVGTRSIYKNFLRLLIAFGQSGLAKTFDLRVISPREVHFSSEEMVYIHKYHLQESVHLMTAVSDDVLREQYQGAVALVYPSEYEGFGFPVIEAMASGTLVATSRTSSLPEVGGDVAFYFDPYQTDAIADCLLQITSLSTPERAARIEQGIARARTFTWERCQQQTVDVLQALASSSTG